MSAMASYQYLGLLAVIVMIGFSSFYMDHLLMQTDFDIITGINKQHEMQDELNQMLVYNSDQSFEMDMQLIDNLKQICNALNDCEIEIIIHEREPVEEEV